MKLSQKLSDDAKKYNLPRNFGKDMENLICGDVEIVPIEKPKLRRAKARRMINDRKV